VSPQSTHDWTSTPAAGPEYDNAELREAWADSKSAGDGFTYSVGSIEVRDTRIVNGQLPQFSGVDVDLPPGVLGASREFLLMPVGPIGAQFVPVRQIVLLQCVDAFGAIQWQRYFYGGTAALPEEAYYRRWANARGISVWAGPTPQETRIAICGEQQDDMLPLSQDQGGWVAQPSTHPAPDWTGFVAVYDGTGSLLWTHHFFGPTVASPGSAAQAWPDCAITDVSIRVEGEGENTRDVVTYCGISSWGNSAANPLTDWLAPIRPFAPVAGCATSSGGDTNFAALPFPAGTYQWDGIVGRLSRDHVAPHGNLQREFHSIVGGPEQDGLFGIAEMADNRFVVVGSTSRIGTGAMPAFPFTSVCDPAAPFRVGTQLTFDASATRLPVGDLLLETSVPLGTIGTHPDETPISTIARDVLVHLHNLDTLNAIYVVGATDDPAFFTAVGAIGVPTNLDTLQGPSDGFFLASQDYAPGQTVLVGQLGGGYIGDSGADGLTGISSWNEYTDYLGVCGYSETPGNGFDVQVASLFNNNVRPAGQPPVFEPWSLLRRTLWGGSAEDRPAVMGIRNATCEVSPGSGGLRFETGLGSTIDSDAVGNPAGGGITVDPRVRLTVVGRTRSSDYPVTAAAFQPRYGVPRSFFGTDDAVRTEFDMLPVGVGRTDGTGSDFGPVLVPLSPAGATGATSPPCVLSSFGLRPNEAVPPLQRMLIDYEGANVVGATPGILVVRPPRTGQVIGTMLQYGLPAAAPVNLGGLELWLLDPSAATWLEVWAGPYAETSWRFQFWVPLGDPGIPPPYNTMPISAQLFSLMLCDNTWACGCDPSTNFAIVASPALFFRFI
jgi:hypothetical protein